MAKLCPHCGAELPETGDAICSECRNALDEAPAGSPPPSQHKREAALGTREPSIWYASESRVFAWMKFTWYDDHGAIDTLSEGIRFAGRKLMLYMARLQAARLQEQLAEMAMRRNRSA